ncbi:response regulator [Flavisolibacter nicotianae]|uniref:response regulator n=1 Tax=Flavisolibacter nicotianae TaxID=2364882 RepID=UPI000EB58256|nr:response regulator [Flavisolibacter nicotianae]
MKTTRSKPYTILWADDDQDDLSVICEIVHTITTSCNVAAVESGCAVLHYLDSIRDPSQFPCLVVLDVNMPKLNGLETLAHIKADERYRTLNVAVFTTSNNVRDRQACAKYGVPIRTKPSSYQGFKSVITELLQLCNIA